MVMDLINFLNANSHKIAGVTIVIIIISILVFYLGIYKLGAADERAHLIMYRVFKKMLLISLFALFMFMLTVPKILHGVTDWTIIWFSFIFICGAVEVWLEAKK